MDPVCRVSFVSLLFSGAVHCIVLCCCHCSRRIIGGRTSAPAKYPHVRDSPPSPPHTHTSTDRQTENSETGARVWQRAWPFTVPSAADRRVMESLCMLMALHPYSPYPCSCPTSTPFQHPTRSPLKFTLILACRPIPTSPRAPPRPARHFFPVTATDGGTAIGRTSRAWAAAKYSRHTTGHVPVSAS